MTSGSKRLIGIKAIADYLSTSNRNIYRWEKELGLPLHRIADTKGRSVYANVEELESWIKHKKIDISYKKRLFNFDFVKTKFFSIVLIIATIIVLYFVRNFINGLNPESGTRMHDHVNPVSAIFEGNTIFIKSQAGRIITSYINCDDKSDMNWERYQCLTFSDLDNDGLNEFAGRKYYPEDRNYTLVLFDSTGKELWEKEITNKQEFNGIKFQADFFPMHVRLANVDEEKKYIVTYWRHRTRFISLISSHDFNGSLINKYVHVGHLAALELYDLNNDGTDEVVFSGTNNLLDGEGVLGVLPLTDFKGVSPPYDIEPEHRSIDFRLQKYVPNNPEHGNQKIYLRFKKTDHMKRSQIAHIHAGLIGIDENLLHVWLICWNPEFLKQGLGFQFVFDFEFDLLDIIPDAFLQKHYETLLKRHEIDLPLENLLEIYKNSIFLWVDNKWDALKKNSKVN